MQIFLIILVLIIGNLTIKPSVSKELFTAVDDQEEVEKLLIDFWRHKNQFRERVSRALRKKRETDLCDSRTSFKVLMCELVAQIEHNGLEFDMDEYEDPICWPRPFAVRFVHKQRKLRELYMLKCPFTSYVDFETGRRSFLSPTFYLSRAKDMEALFLYIQENITQPIYPYRYVHSIDYEQVKNLLLEKESTSVSLSTAVAPQMYLVYRKTSVDQRILEYFRIKKVQQREYKYIPNF